MLRLDFASRGFYVLLSAVLQTGGASAVFAGRDFKLAVRCGAVLQTDSASAVFCGA